MNLNELFKELYFSYNIDHFARDYYGVTLHYLGEDELGASHEKINNYIRSKWLKFKDTPEHTHKQKEFEDMLNAMARDSTLMKSIHKTPNNYSTPIIIPWPNE